jgi:hypothetical protein
LLVLQAVSSSGSVWAVGSCSCESVLSRCQRLGGCNVCAVSCGVPFVLCPFGDMLCEFGQQEGFCIVELGS